MMAGTNSMPRYLIRGLRRLGNVSLRFKLLHSTRLRTKLLCAYRELIEKAPRSDCIFASAAI
jgi:hypothetical protein